MRVLLLRLVDHGVHCCWVGLRGYLVVWLLLGLIDVQLGVLALGLAYLLVG